MERNVSSISRELKRNNAKRGYNAWWATSLYLYRRKKCKRQMRFQTDNDLINFTEDCLSKYWSPEIITAKWKEKFPEVKLSHSTIYRAMKSGLLPAYPAEKYLRRRNRLKYKKGNNQTIHPEHEIAERPEGAETRERIGDWEGDTVRGAPGKGCLITCVDRKSRYLTVGISGDMSAQKVSEELRRILSGKPVKTLTLDRGSEFAGFRELEKQLKGTIYFANPHSPWQRGSNENINGLIRFFYPKGSNFLNISHEELDYIVNLINTRPRKCLGWLSPYDIFFSNCCT
jgi:IS30 family transposase